MTQRRLDIEMARRGLAPTRSAARHAIRAGWVSIDGQVITRPGATVPEGAEVAVAPAALRFVSRSGAKLDGALDTFAVPVAGRRTLDVGASTGGFTDCLLQHGAASVLAVDVGTGQLHPSLAADPRVVSREGTDIRALDPAEAGAPFDVVVVDVSFISLGYVAPALVACGDTDTDYVVLVKPQFEVGREALRKDGVVRDAADAAAAVDRALQVLEAAGLAVQGTVPSPVAGDSGNREVLAWLRQRH